MLGERTPSLPGDCRADTSVRFSPILSPFSQSTAFSFQRSQNIDFVPLSPTDAMSDATPMQQAILVNHTMSIQTYLTQLSTAISQLPTSVPLARIPLIGSDAFVALIAKPTLISWAHLLPLLETVWGKSAKVAKEHVTRGQTGVDIVAKLLETVGAAQLAGLEDEERDGAIAWIRALRDAVREKW